MNSMFEQGFEAFNVGLEYEDNPYDGTTTDYDDWAAGWLSASNKEHEDNCHAVVYDLWEVSQLIY